MHPGRSSPPSFFSSTYPHTARTMASTSSASLSSSSGYVCDTIPPARLAKAPSSRSPSPVPPPTPPVTAFAAPILDTSSLDQPGPSVQVHHVPTASSQLAPPPGRKLCVRHQRMADEGTNLKLQQVSSRSSSVPSCPGHSGGALGDRRSFVRGHASRSKAAAGRRTISAPYNFLSHPLNAVPRVGYCSRLCDSGHLPLRFREDRAKLLHAFLADLHCSVLTITTSQALDALPVEERSAVSAIWSNFSSSSHSRRALILHGLLTMCCFSQLSLLSEQLAHLIRIDPFTVLPSEVSLKILGYLDAQSLCRAAQVSKRWKGLADDDVLWRGICEQHIGQKCLKCGWGLPILEKRRVHRHPSPVASPSPLPSTDSKRKRDLEKAPRGEQPPLKRQRSEMIEAASYPASPEPSVPPISDPETSLSPPHNPLLAPNDPPPCDTLTRPWKDVYCERLTIERNWRRGRCTVRTLSGHTDGVMCLQFSETLAHPAFPILITGSYDRTARVWNLETGREIHCLTGHTRAVRALQFDEAKLITGSMDHTMRVWDWRTGKCLRVLEGHTEGVVCLNFDSNVLASGSVDTTVKVWNFRTGECFTLRGHRDWVNSVQLWDSNASSSPSCSSDMSSTVAAASAPGYECSKPCIDPGKMLFSASDDGTIRLWDLAKKTCVRQFTGHVGQVQSLKLLMVDQPREEPAEDEASKPSEGAGATAPRGSHSTAPIGAGSSSNAAPSDLVYFPTSNTASSSRVFVHNPDASGEAKGKTRAGTPVAGKERTAAVSTAKKPVLISGSLDNTIKVWDLDTGKAVQTLFGHIEGVWSIASDKLRLVSGSHDRTIKVCFLLCLSCEWARANNVLPQVWVREEGRCMATLVGHRGAVTCVALGEDKIVSGSDDGDIRLWSFSP